MCPSACRAITACFGSPLFVLLAGLVASLAMPTWSDVVYLPDDRQLRVLYSMALVVLSVWALVVPLGFRFTLTRRAALVGIAMYATYQVAYIVTLMRGENSSRPARLA